MHNNNNIIIDLFAAWTQHPAMETLITIFHPNPDAEGLNAFSSPKLEERKAIMIIIYIILALNFPSFHLP